MYFKHLSLLQILDIIRALSIKLLLLILHQLNTDIWLLNLEKPEIKDASETINILDTLKMMRNEDMPVESTSIV